MATKFKNGIDAGSQKIQNVATPTTGTDAANRNYVDSAIATGGNQYLRITAATSSVTGSSSTNTFTKIDHGFKNGMKCYISLIYGGSGLTITTGTYYILNPSDNADTFQIADTFGGTARTFGADVNHVNVVGSTDSSLPLRGTDQNSPVLSSQTLVEVFGTNNKSVFLPLADSSNAGKVYYIRNNKSPSYSKIPLTGNITVSIGASPYTSATLTPPTGTSLSSTGLAPFTTYSISAGTRLPVSATAPYTFTTGSVIPTTVNATLVITLSKAAAASGTTGNATIAIQDVTTSTQIASYKSLQINYMTGSNSSAVLAGPGGLQSGPMGQGSTAIVMSTGYNWRYIGSISSNDLATTL